MLAVLVHDPPEELQFLHISSTAHAALRSLSFGKSPYHRVQAELGHVLGPASAPASPSGRTKPRRCESSACGATPRLVTSPHTTLPVDTPPLVAVKVPSRLLQSSGPADAAPVIVSVAPVTVPDAAKLAAVAAPEAVRVPVPTVVKFPALAVLLMVRVLPVIPVAELRPTLAAPVMLSELPDTAPVDDTSLRTRRRWL